MARALHLDVPEGAPASFALSIPADLKRSGRAIRLIQQDGRTSGSAEPQAHLLRLIHRARSWWEEMILNDLVRLPWRMSMA